MGVSSEMQMEMERRDRRGSAWSGGGGSPCSWSWRRCGGGLQGGAAEAGKRPSLKVETVGFGKWHVDRE